MWGLYLHPTVTPITECVHKTLFPKSHLFLFFNFIVYSFVNVLVQNNQTGGEIKKENPHLNSSLAAEDLRVHPTYLANSHSCLQQNQVVEPYTKHQVILAVNNWLM